MSNPILTNRNYAITYAVAWIIIGAIHEIILIYFYNYELVISVVESVVFNGMFAFIGISIWYPVYYTDIEKHNIANFLINHLASGSLAVGVWLWLSFVILNSVFIDEVYADYLLASMPWRVGMGFLFYLILSTNYYLIIYYHNFKDKLLREAELKALVKESQLSSLRAQINPHFLFNSLNSISALTMIGPDRAQDMVITLSDFLRYSLAQHKESQTTFADELNNIDRYLSIEKIRFGKRLAVKKTINNDCLNHKLPGLILQPLIENCIKYGVYEATNETRIEIQGRCNPEVLEVHVINNYDSNYIPKKGEGIGLKNVASRMRIQYGREDLIKIKKNDTRFEVHLRFPQ
jgi:sensor histidine kinase YesM